MQLRLALALAAGAALLLIVAGGLESGYAQGLATAAALADQEADASSLASHIADYISHHRTAVAALAAQPGLLKMTTEGQRSVLRAFNSAYPDVVAFSTYTADGDPIARSDDRPMVRGPGLAAYDDARRTNQSSLPSPSGWSQRTGSPGRSGP